MDLRSLSRPGLVFGLGLFLGQIDVITSVWRGQLSCAAQRQCWPKGVSRPEGERIPEGVIENCVERPGGGTAAETLFDGLFLIFTLKGASASGVCSPKVPSLCGSRPCT